MFTGNFSMAVGPKDEETPEALESRLGVPIHRREAKVVCDLECDDRRLLPLNYLVITDLRP